MDILKMSCSRLALVLWLVAIHSFIVGVGLIIQFPAVMKLFGFFSCNEHFFPAQGGVFHIVMAIGYSLAAKNPDQYRCLVIFSIIVKGIATVFLLTYYFVVESIWTVLGSGIIDGIMCLLIYFSYISYVKLRDESNSSPDTI